MIQSVTVPNVVMGCC